MKKFRNKTNSREGVCMQTILSALLRFVKTMKGSESGPEKYYYFLLPDDRSIQVGAQYSTTCRK